VTTTVCTQCLLRLKRWIQPVSGVCNAYMVSDTIDFSIVTIARKKPELINVKHKFAITTHCFFNHFLRARTDVLRASAADVVFCKYNRSLH